MRGRLAIGTLGLAAVVGTTACAPALDWREFEPEGSGLRVSFPCRPDRSTRGLTLPGTNVATSMTMLACEADGQTFAVAYADVAEPSAVSGALRALRRAAVGNIGAADVTPAPVRVPGMTANAESGGVVVEGVLPDGRHVREHLLFFARALRVVQAVVVGRAPRPEAVETFFGALQAAR